MMISCQNLYETHKKTLIFEEIRCIKKGSIALNETQKESRSDYGGHAPAPISRDQLQQQMQAALNGGQMRPRKKKQQGSDHKRISDLSTNRSTSSKKRYSNVGEPMPRSAGEAKAEKLRQIKASVASASQGIYTDEAPSATAAEAQRYVRRRSNTPMPPNYSERTRANQPKAPKRYDHETAASGKGGKIAGIIVLVLVVLLMIGYLIGYFSYRNKLLPNTYINDVNVSGMTVADAEQAILNNASTQGITFIKKSGEKVHFDGGEFGSTVSLPDNAMQEVTSESHVLWFTKLLHKTAYQVSVINSYSESSLSNLILSYSWGTTPPTDAYIQKGTDGTYSIVPEDNGDMIDATILMNYTLEQMRNGNNSIQMEDAGCYLQAEVQSADLQVALEECNSLAGLTITYDFEDRQEVLDTSTIADWITADTGGNLEVDKNKIEAWVRENLTKYDTYVPGYTRTFHSTLQGTIEVSLGDYGIYGWKTDVEATVDKLEEYILAGESVTVEPEYSRTAYCRGTDDIGNSYAEVDITNQKVFVYKDGELVLETDCVTGLASDPERATPPGVYRVWTMERNVVLGTYEVQGYEQPVAYWMNFTEIGIGFHDLARSAYGGEIYKTNGSHGCINLPLEAAEKLYDIIDIGYPVIVIP